ncbi:MAG: fasciclin domain-containing protein [Verrucomicrobiota bacterium]
MAASRVVKLEGKGPFTVFAPTDDAFRALPKGTVETLLQEENREKLVDVLTYHVVSGKVSAGDALNARKADSVEGSALKFQIDQGAFKVNESTIQSVDIDGGNGVIHVIDTVLLPPSIAEKMKSKSDGPSNKISSASQSIIDAIEKGVPLYNNGNAAACAEVYENCLISLSENPQFDGEIQTKLEDVIAKGRDHSVMQRAWIYRHALDAMMAEISRRMN